MNEVGRESKGEREAVTHGKNSDSGNLNERPTEVTQEETNQHKDTSGLTQTSGSGGRNESVLDCLKMSEPEDRLNVSRMSPDLHIPRLNGSDSSGFRFLKGWILGGSFPKPDNFTSCQKMKNLD
ncbi:hypothetical protein RUM44_011944 [Polyplax serrata]|uniref:Uncharacterized protein n=1 Tax=Polyplax serrata TaxID=468196 RepID=A0ABR1B9Y0_POLSC